MSDFKVTLSSAERDYLTRRLQADLRETRVEERHTDNLRFKSEVSEEEDIIRTLLAKLKE
jgi:hypothetical protein